MTKKRDDRTRKIEKIKKIDRQKIFAIYSYVKDGNEKEADRQSDRKKRVDNKKSPGNI